MDDDELILFKKYKFIKNIKNVEKHAYIMVLISANFTLIILLSRLHKNRQIREINKKQS